MNNPVRRTTGLNDPASVKLSPKKIRIRELRGGGSRKSERDGAGEKGALEGPHDGVS